MGSYSNYLEKKLQDHLFGKASYTAPTIYLGLSTADPTEDGSGIAEPSGAAGYARVTTAPGDWNACTLGSGLLDNLNALTFPEGTGDWGTLAYWFLSDSGTIAAGNMLVYGSFTVPKAIASGDTARIAAGDLDVTLT
jgi:hypothetical protein